MATEWCSTPRRLQSCLHLPTPTPNCYWAREAWQTDHPHHPCPPEQLGMVPEGEDADGGLPAPPPWSGSALGQGKLPQLPASPLSPGREMVGLPTCLPNWANPEVSGRLSQHMGKQPWLACWYCLEWSAEHVLLLPGFPSDSSQLMTRIHAWDFRRKQHLGPNLTVWNKALSCIC